jgi:hypothetical protein
LIAGAVNGCFPLLTLVAFPQISRHFS